VQAKRNNNGLAAHAFINVLVVCWTDGRLATRFNGNPVPGCTQSSCPAGMLCYPFDPKGGVKVGSLACSATSACGACLWPAKSSHADEHLPPFMRVATHNRSVAP